MKKTMHSPPMTATRGRTANYSYSMMNGFHDKAIGAGARQLGTRQ